MATTLTRASALAAAILCAALLAPAPAGALGLDLKAGIYQTGHLKPRDSHTTLEVGDIAPDFSLPAIGGGRVRLSDFRGRKNVVLSFVPAAWTPVCSDQWPGYNIAESVFKEHDAVLLGITVDSVPTLSAWTKAMGGVWFPVLSDFWPHGKVANLYGILRGDGTSERALFVIDKNDVIRYMDVHDINKRPDLGVLAAELDKLR